MTQDEKKRLHDFAAALTMEEWEIIIQCYDDDSLWEEMRRRIADYKDEALAHRSINRRYREVH